MNGIAFTIPGKLSGKGRPRFVRATGRAYTPAQTENMEAVVRKLGADAMCGRAPFDGPVSLAVRLFLVPPESWSKKRRANAGYAVGRPDLDNILKLLGDSLNAVVWTDDAKIAVLNVSRSYRLNGPAFTQVVVEPLTYSVPVPLLFELEAA